jgi:hypothetical protein
MDTVRIVYKTKKFNADEHIRLTFEVLDTLDAFGRSVTVSRSYYFDKKHRTISSVREYANPKKPRKGTRVVYSFTKNKLAAVTVIPPRKACKDCASEYYYASDTLLSKRESIYTNSDPTVFVKQAHYFQSKLPQHLPFGYFENEVIENGKGRRMQR